MFGLGLARWRDRVAPVHMSNRHSLSPRDKPAAVTPLLLLAPRSFSPNEWLRSACIISVSLVLVMNVAASDDCMIYVSNERSGDVTVIDGANNAVLSTLPVGKRPRGIHCSP